MQDGGGHPSSPAALGGSQQGGMQGDTERDGAAKEQVHPGLCGGIWKPSAPHWDPSSRCLWVRLAGHCLGRHLPWCHRGGEAGTAQDSDTMEVRVTWHSPSVPAQPIHHGQ